MTPEVGTLACTAAGGLVVLAPSLSAQLCQLATNKSVLSDV